MAGRKFSLKVDGLHSEVSKDELRGAFEQFGEIGDVYIPKDRDFGFVRFGQEEEAAAAQEAMDGTEIMGTAVHVSFARNRDRDGAEQAGQRRRPPSPGRGEGDGYSDNPPPAKRARKNDAGPCAFKVLCSDHVVASLIGKGGGTLAEINKETGAHLEFSPRGAYFPDTRCRTLTIRASDMERVQMVLDHLVDHVQEASASLGDENSKGRFDGDCRVVALVARFAAGSLIGKGGEGMRKLQSELQCFIEVEKNPVVEGHQQVELRGEAAEVKRALAVVNERVQGEANRDWFPAWAAADPIAGSSAGSGKVGSRGGPPQQENGASRDRDWDRDWDRGRGREDSDTPSEEELASFRSRYPMDTGAWDYLSNAPGSIRAKVLRDFRAKPPPKGSSNKDFSALVVSFVGNMMKRTGDTAGWSQAESLRVVEAPSYDEYPREDRNGGYDRRSPRRTRQEFDRSPDIYDLKWFEGVASEMPPEYMHPVYSIDCMLPSARCGALVGRKGSYISMVEQRTGAKVQLEKETIDDCLRLQIQGSLMSIYAAHLLMMKAYNDAEQEERRREGGSEAAKIEELEREIARLK